MSRRFGTPVFGYSVSQRSGSVLVHRKCLAVLITVVTALATVGAAVPASAGAAAAPRRTVAVKPVEQAVVPVVAELSDLDLSSRVRFAHVRVYSLVPGHGHRPGLVGAGLTGSEGVAFVRLNTSQAPRFMAVAVSGGWVGTRHRRGSLVRILKYEPQQAVLVTSPAAHGRAAADAAGPASSANGPAGNASCWSAAAQTTAAFAQFAGFTGVPGPVPPLPSGCTAPPAESPSAARGRLTSNGPIGVADGIGDIIGLAGLAVSIYSSAASTSQLNTIISQLNTMQAQLTSMQSQLSGISTAIQNLNVDISDTEISTLASEASSTITSIQTAVTDTRALLGGAYQIACDTTTPITTPPAPGQCTRPSRTAGGFGNFISALCYPNGIPAASLAAECSNFLTAYNNVWDDFHGKTPVEAIKDMASQALGSAGPQGGPGNAGIVQYALAAGAPASQFFQTSDAAYARLQWGYYTLYSVLGQVLLEVGGGLGIGEAEPHPPGEKHPPVVTAADVANLTNGANTTIDDYMGMFPNMPDQAVIYTNASGYGNLEGDVPYMFAQQVGGEITSSIFQANDQYTLAAAGGGATITVTATNSGIAVTPGSGQPPLVMTPAAADGDTWVLVPTSGKPVVPAMSWSYFPDWWAGQSYDSQSLPEWDSSTQTVAIGNRGLHGPVADLYENAPSGSQTAGQWMTGVSGINPALLTPQGTGYNSASSGIQGWYGQSGTDHKDPGLDFGSCPPQGNSWCLLPTWQTVGWDPYSDADTSGQTYNSGSSQLNTGLFDYNNGVVIANQQGGNGEPNNPSAFVNQYPNWTNSTNIRGVLFLGYLSALNGASGADLSPAAWNSAGRPVLFDRTQTANDCFYYTGSYNSSSGQSIPTGPAGGNGCLTPRTQSGDILPSS
jgi:hypothetical protein